MSLKRPVIRTEPRLPPEPPEVRVFDVTRLDVVVESSGGRPLPLGFNLDPKKKHSYKIDTKWMIVKLDKRVIRIALPRILYYEESPSKATEVVKPLSA